MESCFCSFLLYPKVLPSSRGTQIVQKRLSQLTRDTLIEGRATHSFKNKDKFTHNEGLHDEITQLLRS